MAEEGPSFHTGEPPGPDTHGRGGSSSAKTPLGFGWGKLWIVLAYWYGGLALVFGFIMGVTTEYLPSRTVSLLIGLPLVVAAYGVHRRRRFGFYLVLALSVLQALTGLVMVLLGDSAEKVGGLVGMVVGALWFVYYQRRKDLFT